LWFESFHKKKKTPIQQIKPLAQLRLQNTQTDSRKENPNSTKRNMKSLP